MAITITTTTAPVASGGEQVILEEPCHNMSEQVQESVPTDWLDEFPFELTELLGCPRCCDFARSDGYSGCYEHYPHQWTEPEDAERDEWIANNVGVDGDVYYGDKEDDWCYYSDEEEECSCATDPPLYNDCHICGYEC